MTLTTWDLTALLNAADPRASLPERHLWWVRLLEWLRHGEPTHGRTPDATPAAVLRLRQLCQVLERHEEHRLRVQGLARSLLLEADTITLLVDFGLAPRGSFGHELTGRLRAKVLPGTPDTRNGAELFALVFSPDDASWLARLDDATRQRLAALWPSSEAPWRTAILDSITMLCSAIRAAGFSSALRLRMGDESRHLPAFTALARAADDLCDAMESGHQAAVDEASAALRSLLASCRDAGDSVLQHLEEFGVSLDIVFDVDQLRLRTKRVEWLLELLLSEGEQSAQVQRLLLTWADTLRESRSVRSLVRQESRLLSRQVAERNAETGEHYITRTAPEYRAMLRSALGGGAVIAGTTLAKFGLGALGLSAFWGGVAAGLNYAASFVLVMLLHWTVATKQPAMTAPAMAAKLATLQQEGSDEGQAIEGFVDEVTHLIRSQFAGILGNLAMCFPLVLLLQVVSHGLLGEGLISPEKAQAVLAGQSLLGPTALFAAFTGVLLFASSLVAGWVENAFVLHRLHSALRWNPWLLARLGSGRAQRWADWWRQHISSVAANVSLGLMLGIVPVLLQFVGLHLDVRHVTLASGQLAMALGSLGTGVLREPLFWWCVAAVPAIGLLNLGVSFVLAFRVALRARGIRVAQRSQIYRAVWQRARRAPLSFLWPTGGSGSAGSTPGGPPAVQPITPPGEGR
jgi:site-specific recombinase